MTRTQPAPESTPQEHEHALLLFHRTDLGFSPPPALVSNEQLVLFHRTDNGFSPLPALVSRAV